MKHPALLLLCSSGLLACTASVEAPSPTPTPSTSSTSQELTAPAGVVCDVKAYGARGDGVTKDTVAIQAAINACAAKAPATVWMHDGVFLSGTIRLKSGITLQIDSTATLKGSQVDADYPTLIVPTVNSQLQDTQRSLIYIGQANGVNITGSGTIDGSGGNPNWTGPEGTRPMAIFTALSQNVTIQNVHVKDAGMWAVVSLESDYITINAIDIHSDIGPNRDGIDIVDCYHVLVQNSSVWSGDDAIVLKSGSSRGVYDVTVKYTHVLHSGSNGLKLGTASTGFFSTVVFDHVDISNVYAAAMSTMSVDGGWVDNIRFTNITTNIVGEPFFILRGRRLLPPALQVGAVGNIHFENISGNAFNTWGSAISGTQELFSTYKVKNIYFSNVAITNLAGLGYVPAAPPEYQGQYPDPSMWGNLPAYGEFFRHVDGLYLHNFGTVPGPGEVRPPFYVQDVSNIVVY